MINSLKTLLEYQLSLGQSLGGHAKLDLRLSNQDKLVIDSKLDMAKFLPASCLEVIKRYQVFNKIIGYFSISPINWDTDNIVDSLIRAQSTEESFLPRTLLDPLDLYWIGNNNNDTIYVAGGNSPCYKESEIVAIHEFILSAKAEEDPANYRLLLAKNFEQFLIIAGNLNDVHRMQLEPEQGKLEMETRLKTLEVAEKYHEAWFEYL
jgi:hypothetical protein